MLHAVGKQLYDGVAPVRLNGVNDTTVLAWQMGNILGQYPTYLYSNHNIPQYPVPGSINSDQDCEIPSGSYKEFWYKYFWILHQLGGQTSAAPPYGYHADVSGVTALNHLRVGGHDGWGRDLQFDAFVQRRSQTDIAIKDMLDMAYANGIYVNITMGGTPPEDSKFGSGDLFTIGTNAYNNYVQYCADYINAYGDHPAIACFNLFNEPINFDGTNKSPWWVARYGTGIVTPAQSGLRQNYEAWEAQAIIWKKTLLANVKAKVTLNPRPLLTIGGGNYSISWQWADPAVVDAQKLRAQDYAENDDLIVGHPYWGAEDDYLIDWMSRTATFLNKPGYTEEWGYNQTSTGPPWYSYWPWADLTFQKYNQNACMMVLSDMPNPTPVGGAYILPKPNYPGYPISQSVMDAATAAWAVYNNQVPTCEDDHPYPQCIQNLQTGMWEIWQCIDGEWTNTGEVCSTPEPSPNMLPWLMLGGATLLLGYGVFRKM